MKKMIPRTVAVFLVLSAGLLAMTLTLKKSEASSPAWNAPHDQTISQWEYQTMVARSPEELVAQANRGGTDSWEMVSVVHVLNNDRYQWAGFFKRLKR